MVLPAGGLAWGVSKAGDLPKEGLEPARLRPLGQAKVFLER